MKLKKGLVHIYTGNGKGKTTAAIGLGVRAAGNGLKVCLWQFLKGKGITYGEARATRRLGPGFKIISLGQAHPCFVAPSQRKKIRAQLKKSIPEALEDIKKAMRSKRYDLIILDELLTAMRDGFVDVKQVLELIESRPKKLEVVLTGRGLHRALIKKADYVTEMCQVRHPYKKGIKARQGIEY